MDTTKKSVKLQNDSLDYNKILFLWTFGFTLKYNFSTNQNSYINVCFCYLQDFLLTFLLKQLNIVMALYKIFVLTSIRLEVESFLWNSKENLMIE